MHSPFLYPWVVRPLRLALRVYFRRIRVLGRERLPDGPVILAANHPQSITDALVLAGSMNRVVHYLGHRGLFKPRLTNWVLHALGAIPIARANEGATAETNQDAFRDCIEALADGACIAIFPEGVSQERPQLQPLKTGAARIALEAEQAHDFGLGVRVVPVGLLFQNAVRFRSRVLVNIGRPIDVGERAQAYGQDPRETVRQLTADLTDSLRRLVIDVAHDDLEEVVRDAAEIYREELLNREGVVVPGDTKFVRETFASQGIAQAATYFAEHDPESVVSLATALRHYRKQRERWHLDDDMIRKGRVPTIRRRALGLIAMSLLSLPIVVAGGLLNGVPYLVTRLLVSRQQPDSTKRHYFQLVIGAAVWSAYYPFLWWQLHQQWSLSTQTTLVLAALTVPIGLAARWLVRFLLRQREMVRFAFLGATHRAALRNLSRLRRQLVSEMDQLLHRYLKAHPNLSEKPS